MSLEAQNLPRRLARTTAGAWTFSVLLMVVLAVGVRFQAESNYLDDLLKAHAFAAYGLGWFEDCDTFHPEFLERDPLLKGQDIKLAVWGLNGPVFGSLPQIFEPIAQQTISSQEEFLDSFDKFRIMSLPAYDDHDQLCGAVIVWAAKARALSPPLPFAVATLIVALLLILLGLFMSEFIARRLLTAHSQQQEEREQLLAGAAHELRTPIAKILALCHAEAPTRDTLDTIKKVSENSSKKLNALLTWAQLAHHQPELEPLRFDLLLDQLELSVPVELEETIVQGNLALLTSLLENLLENAQRHGGGLQKVILKDRCLQVFDHADEPLSESLLEPFHKGRGSSGSGLGLALVARIASVHGAKLGLSKPLSVRFPPPS